MTQLEKINKFSNEEINDIIDSYESDVVEYKLHFVINEKPIPYARARAGRGGRFYNPKAKDEKRYNKIMFSQLSGEDNELLTKLLTSNTAEYYVEIDGYFYVPIQQGDSAKITLLKERKVIRPDLRNGDIDNYMKLLLDSLHGIVYNDDKIVSSIKAEKYYSINPRSEINIILFIRKF